LKSNFLKFDELLNLIQFLEELGGCRGQKVIYLKSSLVGEGNLTPFLPASQDAGNRIAFKIYD
jgi:hypothetical protein